MNSVNRPSDWQITEGYIDCPDVAIYYKTIGKGKPLFILHGGPGASHEYLLRSLLPLAKVRTLVFLDQRGCGNSGIPQGPDPYSLEKHLDDIECVRLSLGFETVDLLGHSFGGIVAQAYLIQQPASVGAVVLVATGSSDRRISADLLRVKSRSDPATLSKLEELEKAGIYGPDGAQLQSYRTLADEVLKPYVYAVRPPAWDSPQASYNWQSMRDLWGAFSDFEITGSLRNIDLTIGLRAISAPALILYGDSDLVSDETAYETHHAISGSELARIDNAGHELYADQPQAFISLTAKFLQEHP